MPASHHKGRRIHLYKWLQCIAKDDLTVNADLISRLLKSDNLERGHPAVEEYCLKAIRRSTSRLIIRERQPNQMLHLLCCTSSATSSASPLLAPPHIAYRFALCGQPSGPCLLFIFPIDCSLGSGFPKHGNSNFMCRLCAVELYIFVC